MVLGRKEVSVVPLQATDSTYPPCPASLKYGVVADSGMGTFHLGLCADDPFVQLKGPLRKRENRVPALPEQPKMPTKTLPLVVDRPDPPIGCDLRFAVKRIIY